MIAGPAHRVYFSGDSGYTKVMVVASAEAFQEIGKAHGSFDLAMIKIGASDPSWPAIHLSPEDAVRAARDVRASLMVPVHWATFNLAYHAWRDPVDRAVAAAERADVRLVVPKIGELVEPLNPPALERWWGGTERSEAALRDSRRRARHTSRVKTRGTFRR